MTFLRAIPCPAVSPRRSFSAKMGALAKEDAPCAVHIFCSMRITEDVRRYAAEQGLSDEAAIKQGMVEKAKEFTTNGEVYQRV